MKTEKLTFGSSVHGIDANTVTPAEIAELKDHLYKSRLIVLKDQAVSEQQYCDFATRFGSPVPYLQENYRHPDYPLIFVSSNIKKDGKSIGVARTGGYWHSDTSFEREPKVITMLMPKVLPVHHARSTKFIDMAEVYAALPRSIKDRLAGAELLHSGRYRYKIRPDNVGYDIFEILQAIDGYAPPVRHPAVIKHPYTGEDVLYANSGFTIGMADRSLDEAASLLKEIFAFAESDRFVREVRWSMGDIIIWDNRFLSHTSGRNSGPEEETMMHRITLQDGYPLCGRKHASRQAA
ncbi:MAG TPA: TauD/TfdA family dioxygenase [Hyphomicrobiaceae bacterium]|nr:TauD/TfdA family dioxygenase [Hyphomicrobiaceae bacterium]